MILVFLLSAALASTSMIVSGSAEAFISAPGTAPNVVILSGGGKVPETGSVDVGQLRNATTVAGVLAASPEVYAPVELEGGVAIVRGVNFSDFSSLQAVTPTEGSLAPLDNSTVYVGTSLAGALGLQVGSTLRLQGVLANSSATVRVAAVVAAGVPFDSEIISSLALASQLAGLLPSLATFERLKVDPAVFNDTRLVQAISEESRSQPSGGNPVVQQVALAPTSSLISIFPAGAPTPTVASVLSRGFGVVQATFEALDAVVLVVSLLAVFFATSYWLEAVRPTAETLGALGMPKGRRLRWHLLQAVPGSVIAGLAGSVAALVALQYASEGGSLNFFFQPIQPSLGPIALVLSCAGPALAVAASVAVRSDLMG